MLDQTVYNFEVFTEDFYEAEKDSPLHGSNYFRVGALFQVWKICESFWHGMLMVEKAE
jgi:hypothetical protein